MKRWLETWLVPLILASFCIIAIIFIAYITFISLSGVTFDDGHDCSVCEWNYVHGELLDYNDPGYGHAGALDEIWYVANYGKKVDLDWYENYRLKYELSSVKSFYLINYSNICSREPNLKYIGTGYIVNFIDWSYDSPAYSKTTICINGTNRTFDNCRWNPYPYNKSVLTHVVRRKHGVWWNNFKEASLYDAYRNPNLPEVNNQSWVVYFNNYQKYLDNGGVDISSEYKDRNWDFPDLIYEYP